MDTYKILAQSNPSAATLTPIYTASGLGTVISTIVVCNRSAVPTTFRISCAQAGEADNAKQYLFYDSTIGANETITITIGCTFANTDVLRVYATLATLSFNVFGLELS